MVCAWIQQVCDESLPHAGTTLASDDTKALLSCALEEDHKEPGRGGLEQWIAVPHEEGWL